MTTLSLLAHQSHENYITLEAKEQIYTLHCEIETDNFAKVINLDDNNNTIVSWQELRSHESEIGDYLLEHLRLIEGKKAIVLHRGHLELFRRDDQTYLRLRMKSDMIETSEPIRLEYDLFFDIDPLQRLYMSVKEGNKKAQIVLLPKKRTLVLEAENLTLWQQFVTFFVDGIWHIWSGFDHLLFLLMLILPTMVFKGAEGYERVQSKKGLLWNILGIVTLFSIAHSLTLGLAFMDYARINVKFVESMILLSIIITALFNIFSIVPKKLYVLVFIFGLLHGFGFANALSAVDLDELHVLLTLLGFNLGIEVGQIVLVAISIPLLYSLAGYAIYEKVIIKSISTITIVMALYWLTLLLGR